MNTVEDKRKVEQIQSLFYKFDKNGNGHLRMEEIHQMFKSIGLEIPITQLYHLFVHTNRHSLEDNLTRINKRKFTLNDFQEAMLSTQS